MADKPIYTSESSEALYELAADNAQAVVLATAAFLAETGVPLDAWTGALGAIFANAWDDPRPWPAGEFLDAMLTNYRAFGAEIVQANLGDREAHAVLRGFPNAGLSEALQVDVELADCYLSVPEQLAADRALLWRWSRNGPDVHLAVTSQEN